MVMQWQVKAQSQASAWQDAVDNEKWQAKVSQTYPPGEWESTITHDKLQSHDAAKNPLHSQLHKTKFCIYNLKGTCQYGDACAFAHSYSELQATPDLRKTKLCVKFIEAGRCDDPNCPFAHGGEELRSTNMFYKKSLCMWHEKGKCHNGDRCHFAHGTHELKLSNSPGGQSSSGQSTKQPSSTSGTATPEDDEQGASFFKPMMPPTDDVGKSKGKGKGNAYTSRGAAKGLVFGASHNTSMLEEPMKIDPSRTEVDVEPWPKWNGSLDGLNNQEVRGASSSDELKAEIARLNHVLAELSQGVQHCMDPVVIDPAVMAQAALPMWGPWDMDPTCMQTMWYPDMPWQQDWSHGGDGGWAEGLAETLKEASCLQACSTTIQQEDGAEAKMPEEGLGA